MAGHRLAVRGLLLDTHAFFWSALYPDRLSAAARSAIEHDDLFVSAVTGYELAQKFRLGRMPDALPLVDSFSDAVRGLLATHLPVTDHHAVRAGLLDWSHRDPFDRILAAQALAEDLVLASRDRAMTTAPGVTVLW